MYVAFRFILGAVGVQNLINFQHILYYAIFFSFVHGSVLGLVSYFIDKLFVIAKSAIWVITFQFLISIIVFLCTFASIRHFTPGHHIPENNFTDNNWNDLFWLLFIQYTIASIVILVGNQTFRKYGRDVFVPLLLGMYRKPREEHRIFLFIDIKSSTTIAEKLGHLQYSSLIHHFMQDINTCLFKYKANIYQYAGDEVVITWRQSPKNAERCVHFLFACKKLLEKRRKFYLSHYRLMPIFKAGADAGLVTAIEIGDIKRDIAYHGDTVNTASRIQGMCNELQKNFLISYSFYECLPSHHKKLASFTGTFILKGKQNKTKIFSMTED
jgi:adenylate cyclase